MRITLAGAALLCAVSTGRAQDFRPSQRAEMTQWIAKTEIQLRYIRPVARGRELFGKLVPLGKPWTPSADSAMRISFSTDVRINGQALAAGAYTVWAIPDSAQWTLIYNKRDRLFHMRTYVESDDALKVTAKVETLVFTHMVPPINPPVMEQMFLRGVAEIYKGKVVIAKDGMRFDLPARN